MREDTSHAIGALFPTVAQALAVAILAAVFAASGSLNGQLLPITRVSSTRAVPAAATESQPSAEWQPAQNGPPAEDLYSVAYGNGLYLAGGSYGTLLTSPDGIAWTPRTSGTTYLLNGLAYGGGQYVAVDNFGSVLTSPDGTAWTTRISPATVFPCPAYSSVVYGSGRFVVVGSSICPFAPFSWTTLTSTDGVTWTPQKGDGFALGGVTYGNGLFVAVGTETAGHGAVLTSSNGVHWTRRSAGTSRYLGSVAFGGGQFVALGFYGSLLTSTDGIEWTDNTIGPGTFADITYGAGQFVAVGSAGKILTSLDGTTWTTRTSITANDLNAVSYGGGQFLVVGDSGIILLSEDGQTWTKFQTLRVSVAGPGRGRVTSNPGGNSCRATCSWDFEAGVEVGLVPIPDPGFIFLEWQGDCKGSAPCRVVMNAARSVSAIFGIPTAPGISRLLPVVLDVSGSSVHYTTGIALTNNTLNTLGVSMLYTASLGSKQGSGTVTDSLAPGEQKKIPDVLSYLRENGLAIPPSAEQPSQGGTLLVTFQGNDTIDPKLVSVTARTAALTSAPQPIGRAGLAYSGLLDTESSTSSLTLYGLRSTVTDRSNVAVFNTSSEPVTLKVTVYSGSGDGKSVVFKAAETLPPYGWLQYPSVQILDGPGISKGWVTVERTSATGSFSTYAVVNDSKTNDGSFVLPVGGAVTGSTLTVPVLAETPAFRSELILANKSASNVTLTLGYVESQSPSPGAGGTMTVQLAPYEEQIIPEATDFLRSNGVSIGTKDAAPYVGALRITVSGTATENVFAGARTASQSPAGGQFGLFAPCVYSGQEASSEAYLYGLKADSENRSNVAVVNTGDDSAGPILLQLQVYDGDASGVPKGNPVSITLSPGQWDQPGNFLKSSGVANGWVKVTRMSGTAPWIAYGVVNDGGNPGERTGDGAYVPMVVAR